MCCVPDVGNDFLPGDTREGTTILCTTFDEIRETKTLRNLLPKSQKIATCFAVMTRASSVSIWPHLVKLRLLILRAHVFLILAVGQYPGR